jgi:hypothetical protein
MSEEWIVVYVSPENDHRRNVQVFVSDVEPDDCALQPLYAWLDVERELHGGYGGVYVYKLADIRALSDFNNDWNDDSDDEYLTP